MEVTIQNVTSNKAKCVDFINLQVTRAENAPRMSFFRILITDIVKNLCPFTDQLFHEKQFCDVFKWKLETVKVGILCLLKEYI